MEVESFVYFFVNQMMYKWVKHVCSLMGQRFCSLKGAITDPFVYLAGSSRKKKILENIGGTELHLMGGW